MKFFDYDKNASNVEYYEILEDLMERWEHEIVELKEAKGGYDADKIGCYFLKSAMRRILEISSMIGSYLA